MVDALAAYAAVVATAGVAWQAYSWKRDRTLRVVVSLSYGIGVGGSSDLILITLTNNGTFAVTWRQAGLDLQDGSGQFALVAPGPGELAGYRLPAVVAPHDSYRTAITIGAARNAGLDTSRPIVAQARLGSAQIFKSEPTILRTKE